MSKQAEASGKNEGAWTTGGVPSRLASLDAFRGFTMLLMASEGLGIEAVARQYPDSRLWETLSYHFSHVPWRGGGLWDMIQPSFMFMVGVSMAFSYANRAERGQSYAGMLGHAAWRSLLLILLGILLRSRWTFEDVLTQIGLGYVFLFLLWRKPWPVVLGAAVLVLAGDWWLFARWPLPGEGLDLGSVGVDPDFAAEHNFTGFLAHWNKNTNPAHAFDVWFLNLFPRELPFKFNGGGYQTLNFLPSLGTMIFGLLAGEWLRGERSKQGKLWGLVLGGVVLVAVGLGLDLLGVVPLVKRIWTPSWAIYSAGWATLFLAGFHGVIDVAGLRGWAWPGIVVGMNSIAMYVMAKLLPPWIERTIVGLAGGDWIYHVLDGLAPPAAGGGPASYAPMVEHGLVLLVLWFFCWLLYRSRIFIRI